MNRSNDIKDFPFQDYCGINDTEMEDVADKHNLRSFNSWMLPQMIAFFGTFTPIKRDDGLYDARMTGQHNIGKDPWKIGMYKVVNNLRRSALVKTQNTSQYAMYSALVPLILSGFKKYQNIPYSAWSPEGLDILVDKNLCEAMLCPVPHDLSKKDILEAREVGLLIKSGAKMGEVSNPISAWRLTGIKGTKLQGLPALASTMLAQIWVAHPSLRSSYMVLDPRDWDAMPEQLIEYTIEAPVVKMFHTPAKKTYSGDTPW